MKKTLSVVIPCYNEAATLREIVAAVEALASDGLALEILVVDDCSTDGSRAVAEELAAASPSVRVLRHAANQGKGAALTALVRRERDWFVFLMPAAITSCCWTYTQAYSHAMGWFVAFVLARELLRRPQSRFLWALAALSACSLSRGLLAWHGLVAFAGWTFPLSDYAFRCWDSLNSTLSLGLAAALCVWLRRTGPCPVRRGA